jgi:TPR repeat protein
MRKESAMLSESSGCSRRHISYCLLAFALAQCTVSGAIGEIPANPEIPNTGPTSNSGSDTERQYLLGMELATGSNGLVDHAQALGLFRESWAGGELRAAYALGWMYFSGKGIDKDYDQAFLLFTKAAEKGLPEAQHMLGLMYGNGWGVKKDTKLSLYWTRRAADNGNPEATAIIQLLREKFGQ